MNRRTLFRVATSSYACALIFAFSGCANHAPRAPELSAASRVASLPRGAATWVRSAIAAMGGEETLRGLRRLRLEGAGHVHMLEQSERPEGPWFTIYLQFEEQFDFEKGALRRSTERRMLLSPDVNKGTDIVSSGVMAKLHGEKMQPGTVPEKDEGEIRLALGPERVLLHALDARDLADGEDAVLQGVMHHIVRFTWRSLAVRIYFNGDTGLPTAVEYVNYPRDSFWGVWGDVTTRFLFSAWELYRVGPGSPAGLRYPLQWDTERNGLPLESRGITRVIINPAIPDDAFAIPTDVAKAYPAHHWPVIDDGALGAPQKPPQILRDGIVEIPGAWDVTLVRQRDGVVIVEAPISSNYSARVLAEAKRRFPDLPVKAVISTSDAWPHLGGLREYAAEGIPIYLLDRNRPLVERLLSAPYRIAPDKLAKTPREPKLRPVSRLETIGDGPNRIELRPFHTEAGERMFMVAFPEHRLLYTSDMVQRYPDGHFAFPEQLLEVTQAVAREKLTVEHVFGMHVGLTAWGAIVDDVQKARTSAPVENVK